MLFGQQFIGKYLKFRQQIDNSVIKLNQNIAKRIRQKYGAPSAIIGQQSTALSDDNLFTFEVKIPQEMARSAHLDSELDRLFEDYAPKRK